MGLLSKLSGKDNKGGDAFLFVFGTDKRFVRRDMALQGTHLQDNNNRMAYFSSPESNGVLSKQVRDIARNMGPVGVACEPIPELFSFPELKWSADRSKPVKGGGNGQHELFEDDPIVDNSWAEGWSLAGQRQDNTETRNKLLQILLIAVVGVVALFLLVAASTGLLSEFISGAGKFFGSG